MHKFIIFIFFTVVSLPDSSAQTTSSNIFTAVKENDIATVRSLLSQGTDPNCYDEDGDRLLMLAALYSSVDCMQLLLEKGSDPNGKNILDETALIWSLHDPAKIKLLIQHGADVNAKAKSGNTAFLIAAVGHENLETLTLLMKSGADVLALNNRKENALIRAASFGDTATVSFLINKGIDVNARSSDTATALINAALNVNTPVVIQLLENGADPDVICFFGLTALAAAATYDDVESVTALLKKVKKINVQDQLGFTPLIWAAYNEHDNVAIIRAIIDKGANINMKSNDGSTALSMALKKGNTPTVALLQKAGAK